MWQRFTERARKVVFYAQEEAQRYGEGYVSTEHLLLGLIRESDSVAATVLEGLGISLKRLRMEVEMHLPQGDARASQDMTLTPRAKRVIDLAYEEARCLNNNYIGTEHLFLGLVREGEGMAGRVLIKLGVDLEAARKKVMEVQDKAEPRTDLPPRPVRSSVSTPNATEGNSWQVLAMKRRRMMADQLCLMFLYEAESSACEACIAIGVSPADLCSAIEEEVLAKKSPEELAKGALTASEILSQAVRIAATAGQEFGSAHLLLAAIIDGSTATGNSLTALGGTAKSMETWLARSPIE